VTRDISRAFPEGIEWLEKVKLAKPDAGGRTHPTYIELQTNRPMYVHRRGSNIVNGEYYIDYNPERPIGHYGQTRKINTAALRKHYEDGAQGGCAGAGEKLPDRAWHRHCRTTAVLRGSIRAAGGKGSARTGARLALGAEQDGLLAGAIAANQSSI
jgi:hypothetical protein